MNAPPSVIETLAQRLRDAESSRVPCAPLRDELHAGGVASAYAVQQQNVTAGVAQGRRVVGRKIGLTSPAVQIQLGVDEPDYGTIFADMVLNDGEVVAPERVLQPRVEGEVALVLERDLVREQFTVVDVMRAVAFVLPAIEIVGSRIANWDIGLLDTIADNASGGAVVLGGTPRLLRDLDLRSSAMIMSRDGEVVAQGSGVDCMGSPLVAAAWLAGRMAAVGTPLRAGDIVMTGALGPMASVRPGEDYAMAIDNVGTVRVAFAAASD